MSKRQNKTTLQELESNLNFEGFSLLAQIATLLLLYFYEYVAFLFFIPLILLAISFYAFYKDTKGGTYHDWDATIDTETGEPVVSAIPLVGVASLALLMVMAGRLDALAEVIFAIFIPLTLYTFIWMSRFGRFFRKFKYNTTRKFAPVLVFFGLALLPLIYYGATADQFYRYPPLFASAFPAYILFFMYSILLGLWFSMLIGEPKLWLSTNKKPTGKLNPLRSKHRSRPGGPIYAEEIVIKNSLPGNYQFLSLLQARDEEIPTLFHGISSPATEEYKNLRKVMDAGRATILKNEPAIRASWPHVFCSHCRVRPEMRQLSQNFQTPVCPKCNSGKWLELNVREVVGVFNENTQWRHVGDQLFVGLWDDAKKQACPAQVDILSIEGGASPARDWAVNSWLQAMETFKYAGKKPAVLPLKAQQKLSENTLRMAAASKRIFLEKT